MFVENEYKCANCVDSEETNRSWKIYCKRYKTYYDKTETCKYQKRKVRAEDGTPCYITTIVCNILGLDDHCVVLDELRNLRNNVMQKDSKYKEMLYEYDTVGPQIANCLREDNDNKEIATYFYNAFIEPTARLTVSRKYEEAVSKYYAMTEKLRDYYGLVIDNTDIDNYDYTQGGHGYVKKYYN